ncbi:MAG: SDR family oxidoreductase [Desulfobacterales bacterium]|nr:SDR family oxidoreductase [Desulfobacterales bacterium]MDJ0875581.1 SDR family oxidoreductase [Desulfobacterales bacterium]MDJ0882939.1 SDR family oxidoreductase [Desulfobacterales bacterium]
MQAFDLDGKVALVTGASRGIGRAVAEELALSGAAVALNYVADQAAADKVVDGIAADGGRAQAFQADLAESAQVEALFRAVQATFGRLDILVNNAGLARYGPIRDYPIEDFDRLMAVNVRGPFLACRLAARQMADGGAIINITSTVTRVMLPNYGVYAATKGALEQLTRVLAKELGPRSITVNAVAPGPTDTDLFRHGKTEAQIESLAGMAALGRLGTPLDTARVVVFLAGPQGRWVSGQVIPVNGGFA